MTKRKVKNSLKQFKGMQWDRVCEEVQVNVLPLVMSKDWICEEAGRASSICNGEAGAAIIVAGLCVKRWGAEKTAHKGVDIYSDLAKRRGMGGLEYLLSEMKYWMAWKHGGVHNKKWPVKLPDWDDDDKWGGLANVMLGISASEMAEEGSNTSLLAARAIMKFLDEGMRLRSEKAA